MGKGFPYMFPEEVNDTLDAARAANNGRPPATIRFDGKDVPNPTKNDPPSSYLGVAQKKWFLERLTQSNAPWKIWGHSFGTLSGRTDPLNLPPGLAGRTWPGEGYAQINGGGYVVDHAEIMDVVRDRGITGLAIVAGDRHSFWAGRVSKALPPQTVRAGGRRIRHRLDLGPGPLRGDGTRDEEGSPAARALSARSPATAASAPR